MIFKKTITTIMLVCFVAMSVSAQDKKPASPAATAAGKINGANITIVYSSPFVKGRTIWGDLVPYGKVWRAGANAPTTFTTDKLLMVEGQSLPAGTYSIYIIPEKETATVIFGKDVKMGASDYKDSQDQLRVNVKPKKSAQMNESIVYKVNNNNVTLSWENLDIPISVK